MSANQAAGFSIITYTGNGNTATIGHGLTTTPQFIIGKARATSSQQNKWLIYHSLLGNTGRLTFDTAALTPDGVAWNNTSPTSSVITVGTALSDNTIGHVLYAWSEVP